MKAGLLEGIILEESCIGLRIVMQCIEKSSGDFGRIYVRHIVGFDVDRGVTTYILDKPVFRNVRTENGGTFDVDTPLDRIGIRRGWPLENDSLLCHVNGTAIAVEILKLGDARALIED